MNYDFGMARKYAPAFLFLFDDLGYDLYANIPSGEIWVAELDSLSPENMCNV